MGNKHKSHELSRDPKFLDMDDPKYLHAPARLGGYDHVVVKLPLYLTWKPILKELLSKKLMKEECECFEYDGAICIQKQTTREAKRLKAYLNNKYGPISSLGYQARLLGTKGKKVEYATQGHLATVENPTGTD